LSYGEAIWNDWFSVAEPLNKLTTWLTLGLTILCWMLFPINPIGYNGLLLVSHAWRYVLCIIASIFYFVVLKEKIEARNLENATHIWLLICLILSVFTIAGVFIWVQFIMVGILSDRPIWRVFSEQGVRYY
jgi:hypothetical protein